MRKILCPNCKKIVSFEEGGAIRCGFCNAELKVTVFSTDDKNVAADMRSDNKTETAYCGDEIIRAEIAEKSGSDTKSFNDDNTSFAEPPVKDLGATQDKTALTSEKKFINTAAASAPQKESSTTNVQKSQDEQPIGELDGVLPAEVECESEIVTQSELTKETKKELKRVREVSSKYKKKKLYVFVTVIAVVAAAMCAAALYTPFADVVVNDALRNLTWAKLIGFFVTGATAPTAAQTALIYAQGALVMLLVALCAAFVIEALRQYGQYNKKSLNKLNRITCPLGLTAAALFGLDVAFAADSGNVATALNCALFSSVVIFTICIALSIMRFTLTRRAEIIVSPKIVRKKAYFTLGAACFFLWELIIAAVVSEGANIAFSVLRSSGADSALLGRLSEISGGVYGALISLVWIDGGITETNLVSSTYASIASGICIFVFVIVYLFYICYTRDIFLGRVDNVDSAKKFAEEGYEKKQLTRRLQKNTSVAFVVFAAVFTAEMARNVLLYMGGGATGAVVFAVVAAAGMLCVRCFPYAQRAREIHLTAYEEFEAMGVEQEPMTNKDRRKIALIPLFIVLSGYAAFIALELAI